MIAVRGSFKQSSEMEGNLTLKKIEAFEKELGIKNRKSIDGQPHL